MRTEDPREDVFLSTVGQVERKLGIVPSFIRQAKILDRLNHAAENAVPFGVRCLDRALLGLMPTDLMLIGAGSGVGKSALGIEIAKNVSEAGKKVLFVALEAEPDEVEMRIAYQYYAQSYFSDPERHKGVNFDYRNFRFHRLREAIWPYHEKVSSHVLKVTQNLHTFYKGPAAYTAEKLLQHVQYAVKEGMGMVVVDHLHYFEMAHGVDQNQSMSQLVQKIRDINLEYQVPIVLVAHLRKGLGGVPGLQDFHGSSDIGKQATLAVMLSKVKDGYNPATGLARTAITVPKSRTGGMPLAMLVDFAVRYNMYLPVYELAFVNEVTGDFKVLRKNELPYWAKEDPDCRNPA